MMQVIDMKRVECIFRKVVPSSLQVLGISGFVCFLLLGMTYQNLVSPSISAGIHRHSTSYPQNCPKCSVFPDESVRENERIAQGVIQDQDNGQIDFERLANAIYRAEGGRKASRPYGVFYPGCNWNNPAYCRKICINTARKSYRRFLAQSGSNSVLDQNSAFILWLSKTYAPIGAKNDPSGLNRHWARNVEAIYGRV